MTGTFGLASYSVTKRLCELSLRVALGAGAKQVLAAALGRMLLLLTIGSTVGLVLGVATSRLRLLSAVVYQASAQDPLVLCAVACTMLLTGLASIATPVRRALHVDPACILRERQKPVVQPNCYPEQLIGLGQVKGGEYKVERLIKKLLASRETADPSTSVARFVCLSEPQVSFQTTPTSLVFIPQ